MFCNAKFGFKVRALIGFSFLFNKSRLIGSGRVCPIEWAYSCWTEMKTLWKPALQSRICRDMTFKDSLEIDHLTSTRSFRVPRRASIINQMVESCSTPSTWSRSSSEALMIDEHDQSCAHFNRRVGSRDRGAHLTYAYNQVIFIAPMCSWAYPRLPWGRRTRFCHQNKLWSPSWCLVSLFYMKVQFWPKWL